MKVFLAGDQEDRQGGGWSFLSCLKQGLGDKVVTYEDSDIVFISGASMVRSGVVEQAKRDDKRIVLRTDNALKPSRNKGYENGMGKMKYYADLADLVIYQCQWAKDYLDDFLGHPNSTIIYNGIDLDIFTPEGPKIDFEYAPIFLYASAAKGENKRWDTAWYDYQHAQKQNPSAVLLVAGQVPTAVREHDFDFFQGEHYRYLGLIQDRAQMASIFRSSDFFYAVAENDCYSNTLLESLACGVVPISISYTGGTPELLDNWNKGREYNGLERMVLEYVKAMEALEGITI